MRKVLILLLLTAGCSCFEDKRVVIKPEPVDNKQIWMMLPRILNKRYDNKTLKWKQADLELQKYLSSLVEEPNGRCLDWNK